jgi:hypothetical protein
MRKNISVLLKVILGVSGAFLAVHMIAKLGWRQIGSALVSHAYLILGLFAAYLIWHLMRTWALQICMSISARFSALFSIRLAGEAIAYLAVGSIVGDALKVGLAKNQLPPVEVAKGVFAEKLIYHLAGAGFIIIGLCIAVARLGANKILLYSLVGMVLFFGTLFYLMSSGAQPVSRILKMLHVRKQKIREGVSLAEESIFQFRREHPGKFFLTLLLNLGTFLYSSAEVFVILLVLGYSPSFLEVWYYEAVVKAMNTASFVVPGNLGVFETTNVFLARQIGWGQEAGLLAALIVRIRALLWAIAGYFVFIYLIAKNKKRIS